MNNLDGRRGDRRPARRANFEALLRPDSIVFIGGRGLALPIGYCREVGFSGDIRVVNPTHDEIAGIKCYADIESLPDVPDAAWVAAPPEASVEAVRRLNRLGVRAAVCHAAGFAEAGAGDLQQALIEAAGDMALVGPNSVGIINYMDRKPLAMARIGPVEPPEHGIACIAQSGTVFTNLLRSDRSVPVSYMLSLGNQAVVDIADAIDAISDDPRVDGIALYIEGIKDTEAFAAAATRAFQNGKTIVALAAGASTIGRAVAMSHTGSMASTPDLYSAYFKRLGIVEAGGFAEMIEFCKLLTFDAIPAGNRLMIETCSGADSAYAADLAERNGLDVPQPSPSARAELAQLLPAIATPTNPIDVTVILWGNREAQADVLVTMLKDPADAAVLIIQCPFGLELRMYGPALDAMIDVRAKTDVPCYVISNLPEGLPVEVRNRLIENGIVPLQGFEDGFACLGQAVKNAKWRRHLMDRGGPNGRTIPVQPDLPGEMIGEWGSKALLRGAGMPVPKGLLLPEPENIRNVTASLSFPLVVKGSGDSIAHKSELGAVAVGIRDEATLVEAAERIAGIPGISGLIVEEMVTDAIAEVIVGIRRDPVFGFVLTIGAGGILTELLRDTVTLVLPASEPEIREALEQQKVFTLLDGFRGAPKGDIAALIDAVSSLAGYCEEHASDIVDVEINPIMVRPEGSGVVAVDALITRVRN
ncbi:MAG: acetate--CoA ligase family protein [Alphaproteobacteria bacterium]